jgi:hypothetical protein
MPTTQADSDRSTRRPPMDRRRFFHRCLVAGASGLLAVFGPTDRSGRRDQAAPGPSGDVSLDSRELAG